MASRDGAWLSGASLFGVKKNQRGIIINQMQIYTPWSLDEYYTPAKSNAQYVLKTGIVQFTTHLCTLGEKNGSQRWGEGGPGGHYTLALCMI